MFDIEYKGGNTITITSKKITLCIDPRTSIVGAKDLNTTDKVELGTEARFLMDNPAARLLIEGPGEYEVGDFTIRGVATTRHIDTPSDEQLATMYRVECGDVRVGILGNVDPNLSDDQLEQLGVIDVLIIPVGGGGYTLDATNATHLISQIEPKAIIPVHYAEAGLHYEVPQEPFEVFTKELSMPVEETAKFKVKSAATLPIVPTIIHLTRTA
ncbi:MAG: MBL fold metallo-hydrolase [Candidatus Saccharimonas sp.]